MSELIPASGVRLASLRRGKVGFKLMVLSGGWSLKDFEC